MPTFTFILIKSCVHDVFTESSLNTDTRLIRHHHMLIPLVSVLTGFHCRKLLEISDSPVPVDAWSWSFFFTTSEPLGLSPRSASVDNISAAVNILWGNGCKKASFFKLLTPVTVSLQATCKRGLAHCVKGWVPFSGSLVLGQRWGWERGQNKGRRLCFCLT